MGLVKATLSCYKQKVIYFQVVNKKDPQTNGRARIKITKFNGEEYLSFSLEGVDLDFEMDYSLSSDPEWIHDRGNGRIIIRGMSIGMKLVPYLENGRLRADFTRDEAIEVEMKDYDV
jgi:hypothetical protein